MNITKSQLRKIIREELDSILKEAKQNYDITYLKSDKSIIDGTKVGFGAKYPNLEKAKEEALKHVISGARYARINKTVKGRSFYQGTIDLKTKKFIDESVDLNEQGSSSEHKKIESMIVKSLVNLERVDKLFKSKYPKLHKNHFLDALQAVETLMYHFENDSILESKQSLSVSEKHQKKIAISTLKMSDAGASVMGGMTKEEARKFLKSIGYSDAQIKKLEK